MGKKILITSTDLMMIQCLVPHVLHLSANGWEVEIACSDAGGRIEELRSILKGNVTLHKVRLHRNPANLENVLGYFDIQKIISSKNWDVIWTNEPVMGAVTRIAANRARRKGTKVVYMVHGFHFYHGAPLINWLLFFPVERILAHLTDYIITVNKEDYNRARNFPVKRVEYIHGIGVNTDKLQPDMISLDIREKLGIPGNAFLILSVGELNRNKNQKVIIDALAELKDKDIYYILCGRGKKKKKLKALARKYGIDRNIFFVDYRKDVINFYSQADLFALSSFREGLPVSLLEAMYCEVTPVTSDARGISDVMQNEVTGIVCPPNDGRAFTKAISILKSDRSLLKEYGKNSKKAVELYALSLVKKQVLELLTEFEEANESCR